MQTAYATEMILAVPTSMQDIYRLHQNVWMHVERALAVRHRPTILYRQDRGMVRVRVSDAAVMQGCGTPERAFFEADQRMDWKIRLGLWRREQQATDNHIETRVFNMLERSGVEVLTLRAHKSVSSGRKGSHVIQLPIADVQAQIRVIDPTMAAKAWLNGIGRGRRFGFGMIMAA
jgi:hypothetical protein